MEVAELLKSVQIATNLVQIVLSCFLVFAGIYAYVRIKFNDLAHVEKEQKEQKVELHEIKQEVIKIGKSVAKIEGKLEA